MQPLKKPAAGEPHDAQYQIAGTLLELLQEFGQRASNPVLELLRDSGEFRALRKYPATAFDFGGTGVRAYYHRHADHTASHREHGHFHLFLRVPGSAPEDWSHLAGLAMDQEGQPLRWFTVNRWVSGGAWSGAPELCGSLGGLGPVQHLSLVERWLLTMLRLYDAELRRLLSERDRRLTQLKADAATDSILEDRQIHELSEQPIDLLHKLQGLLVGGQQIVNPPYQEV